MKLDLDTVAYMVYLRTWCKDDEEPYDLGEALLKRLRHKWDNELLPHKNAKHNGDCTGNPYTCIKCSVEGIYSEAEFILNSCDN